MATILIAGGTGLIGSQLSSTLGAAGHKVRLLSRNPNSINDPVVFHWNPSKGIIDKSALVEVDYVINLAGAGIADSRWTAKRKQLIIESRTQSAALLLKSFQGDLAPKAYLAASAIGYYGDRGQETMTAESHPGNGFLSESVIAWEKANLKIAEAGIPTAIIRIGIVLSTKGGALAKMLASYPFKLGAYFGNGEQIYSWIHIEDLARIFQFLIERQFQKGVLNAVAPQPVSNKKLAQEINKAGNYGAFIMPAPGWALKLMLGEMAQVVLDSTAVNCEKLQDAGFEFKWPRLQEALTDLLKRKL